ncbi:MAG: TIGR04282 family arsenosugar biosynthesis glycosyltransferase [Pseudomonadota bacterium]
MRRMLFIMVKEPRPGRVKTRLGRDIGMVSAAWWFRHQTQRLIRRLSADPRWDTVICVSPDVEGARSRVWPAHLAIWLQGRGDLGDRMGRIFREAPGGPAIIIGADIPGITRQDIWVGFQALGENGAVIGPAPDGGYWLIGMKRGSAPVPRGLFNDVRWSTEDARDDTIASLRNVSVATLRELRDVDRAEDLKRV